MTLLTKWNLLDHRLFCLVHRFSHLKLLYWWARICSFSGDGLVYIVSALGLYQFKMTPQLKILALGFAIERSIYFIAKPLIRRDRPAVALPNFTAFINPADKFSFPSGHSSAAFLFASFLYSTNIDPYGVGFMWAINIAASRVFLGVHFISDVLAGALIGLLIALGLNMLTEL